MICHDGRKVSVLGKSGLGGARTGWELLITLSSENGIALLVMTRSVGPYYHCDFLGTFSAICKVPRRWLVSSHTARYR